MFKESREALCKTQSDNAAVHCSWEQGSQRKGTKTLLLQTFSHLMHFIARKNCDQTGNKSEQQKQQRTDSWKSSPIFYPKKVVSF